MISLDIHNTVWSLSYSRTIQLWLNLEISGNFCFHRNKCKFQILCGNAVRSSYTVFFLFFCFFFFKKRIHCAWSILSLYAISAFHNSFLWCAEPKGQTYIQLN